MSLSAAQVWVVALLQPCAYLAGWLARPRTVEPPPLPIHLHCHCQEDSGEGTEPVLETVCPRADGYGTGDLLGAGLLGVLVGSLPWRRFVTPCARRRASTRQVEGVRPPPGRAWSLEPARDHAAGRLGRDAGGRGTSA